MCRPIKIIKTGKKNEKGNTILSGSLRKIVIPVNSNKLENKENVVIVIKLISNLYLLDNKKLNIKYIHKKNAERNML
jgi:hypothetical protein